MIITVIMSLSEKNMTATSQMSRSSSWEPRSRYIVIILIIIIIINIILFIMIIIIIIVIQK